MTPKNNENNEQFFRLKERAHFRKKGATKVRKEHRKVPERTINFVRCAKAKQSAVCFEIAYMGTLYPTTHELEGGLFENI